MPSEKKSRIHFRPNEPQTFKLADPAGEYDFDLHCGRYQTTDGRELVLPRAGVVRLNALEPSAGEEIGICRYDQKNRRGSEWAVWLTADSEKTRATVEEEPSELAATLKASIEQARNGNPAKEAVTPIRRKPARKQDDQPRLFDRGTGTHGPAPQPSPRLAIAAKTPYGTMLRHIVRTVKAALVDENLQLGDGPTQDLISTVYIDAAKRSGVEYDFTRGEE
jgi:hypothetical protein